MCLMKCRSHKSSQDWFEYFSNYFNLQSLLEAVQLKLSLFEVVDFSRHDNNIIE